MCVSQKVRTLHDTYRQQKLYLTLISNIFFQAWFLLSAESWNEAHEVIVKKIAPDAIINQDYEFFFSLLEDLANIDDPAAKVTNWSTQGQVYHDFITVDLKIRELIEKRDETSVAYDIQTLRPKVMSLCGRIKSLPVNCAKERLCQSEIAKKNGTFGKSCTGFGL